MLRSMTLQRSEMSRDTRGSMLDIQCEVTCAPLCLWRVGVPTEWSTGMRRTYDVGPLIH
jgi:hypothetical protein